MGGSWLRGGISSQTITSESSMARRSWLLIGAVSMVPLAAQVWAEADGPDFYDVTGIESGDVLNVRAKAKYRAPKVGTIPPGGRRGSKARASAPGRSQPSAALEHPDEGVTKVAVRGTRFAERAAQKWPGQRQTQVGRGPGRRAAWSGMPSALILSRPLSSPSLSRTRTSSSGLGLSQT